MSGAELVRRERLGSSARFIRFREAVSSLLWRLHLPGVKGWWDAGTDTLLMDASVAKLDVEHDCYQSWRPR